MVAPFEELQENLGVASQVHLFFEVGIVGAVGVWQDESKAELQNLERSSTNRPLYVCSLREPAHERSVGV